ncbi:P-loop NTPase fold protein, partial [Bacillus swezeyi]
MHINKAIDAWNELEESVDFFNDINLSETDLRCKIIDPLLTKVLSWDEPHIKREPKVSAGFIDYYCKTTRNEFVIEAKSNKVDFCLNQRSSPQPLISSNLQKTKLSLYNAIEQARSYAKEKNCPFCVVSNGLNIIFSKTYSPHDRSIDTIAFVGKDSINRNFHKLYEMLSPFNDGYSYFVNLLEEGKVVRQKPLFSKSISNETYRKDRVGYNPLSAPLTPILTKYFRDITHDKKLMQKVYCNNQNLDSYGQDLKKYIKGRIPLLGLPFEAVDQLEISDESAGKFERDLIMQFQKNNDLKQGHVFVLFGNLGAGKSTFIERFHSQLLRGLHRNLIWCYIDFQTWYGNVDDVETKILSDIEKQLKNIDQIDINEFDTLQEIYKDEISDKLKGTWKGYRNEPDKLEQKIGDFIERYQENKKIHIEKIMNYLITSNFEVCLVLDNLDQQPGDIQERASFYCFAKSKNLNLTTILSLRDETYWAMKSKPPMDAYGNITSYQIVPPSIKDVLVKRIQFVKEVLGEDDVTFDNGGKAVTLKYKDLLNLLSDTLKTEEAEDLLKYLSSGNVRYALEIFSDIVTSGHSNLFQILNYKYEDTQESKIVPFDKLVKSVGLSIGENYNSKNSKLINLFENYSFDGFGSHFINFRIFDILKEHSNESFKFGVSEGFVPLDFIRKKLTVYCNDINNLRRLLAPMLERHIIESDIGSRKMGEDNYLDNIGYVRLAPSAQYHLDKLISNHQYLEMILYDTKIQDENVFNMIFRNYKFHIEKQNDFMDKWKARIENVELFLNYLKMKEEEDFKYLDRENIYKYRKIMPELIRDYKEVSKAKILSRINKSA